MCVAHLGEPELGSAARGAHRQNRQEDGDDRNDPPSH
jgi:hypothetical protein